MEAEITLLKTYLSIEVERLEKKVEFNIEVGPNIDVTQLGIPPMVLQPLLENALWHGIAPSDRPGEVQLRFEAHELKGIQVSLEDNGVGYHGRDREQHGVNKAFGLNSIDKRMQYISQAYNFESSFAIENRSSEVQCGTRQVLVMPRIQI
jgi:sensor histidine kinase YesM